MLPFFFIPHNLPGVWIITSAGLSWAMNKTNSSRVRTFLHPHLLMRRREQQPLVGAASTSLPRFNEWMEALLSLDGLLLQPTVENMTTQQQVGERGFWDGWEVPPPILPLYTQPLVCLCRCLTDSYNQSDFEVRGSALSQNWVIALWAQARHVQIKSQLRNLFQKPRNITPICTRGSWFWGCLFSHEATPRLTLAQREKKNAAHSFIWMRPVQWHSYRPSIFKTNKNGETVIKTL